MKRRKLGCDITVGDRVVSGQGLFLILGFARPVDAGVRVALDCWGDPLELKDHYPYVVVEARLGDLLMEAS